MTTCFKRLLFALAILPSAACTMTPLDLAVPAGIALMRGAGSDGPISVEALLRQARGDTDAPSESGGPITVEAMLANARSVEPAAPNPDAQPAAQNTEQSLELLRAQVMARDSVDQNVKECQ